MFDAGRTDISSFVGETCSVNDLLVSGSKPPVNMALGSKLEKSINSPRMMRSLMRGGTGGNDDWTTVGWIGVGTDAD